MSLFGRESFDREAFEKGKPLAEINPTQGELDAVVGIFLKELDKDEDGKKMAAQCHIQGEAPDILNALEQLTIHVLNGVDFAGASPKFLLKTLHENVEEKLEDKGTDPDEILGKLEELLDHLKDHRGGRR